MKLLAAVLCVLVLSMGCLNFQSTPEEDANITNVTPPSGCSYSNPPCGEGQACVNNTCVMGEILPELTGCDYGNLRCGPDQDCVDNACVARDILAMLEARQSGLASDTKALDSLLREERAIIGNYEVDTSALKQTYLVGPGGDTYLNLNMSKGFLLKGNITIRGGSDFDIDLSITSRNGIVYLPKKRIATRYLMNFTAPEDGRYYMVLGNSFTSFDTKTVRFEMEDGEYRYYQEYLAWAKDFVEEAERMALSIKDFRDFLSEHRERLRLMGQDTDALELSVDSQNADLMQSVAGVNQAIKDMTSHLDSLGKLKQQEQQEASGIISKLDEMMEMPG